MTEIVTQETIDTKIWTIRGKRVILDRDLAVLYNVGCNAPCQIAHP